LLDPLPLPHELPSQSPFEWHDVPPGKAQVPALEPWPLPHELLSQSAFLWHEAPPPCAHVPFTAPVPLPHELLSQSEFAWQTALLVLHVPSDAPLPVPQVPVGPQSESLWHAPPAAQVPSLLPPPHVPSPQSALLWQPTPVLHVPPPHVPLPHCELDVHEIGVQCALPHVPLPQSLLLWHEQTPLLQVRPPPQSRSRVQPAARHTPVVAPAHWYVALGQSAAVRQGSEHCPIEPGVAPLQTAV
jgi:hypothetical protein